MNDRKNKILMIVCIISYLLLGAVLPYIKQPVISDEYMNSFDIDAFYSDEISVDRAAIIEDNGEALEERIRLIANAEKRIIISTYNFRTDESGLDIVSALMNSAQRGVKVYVLLDGSSSWNDNNNSYFKALASEPNVTIKVYNKINLLKPWTAMGRMHDKYFIADDTAYILGGRNIYNYFLGDYNSYKNHDRDVLVYNTRGAGSNSSLYQLLDYFNHIWNLDICSEFYKSKQIKEVSKVEAAKLKLEKHYEQMQEKNPEYFNARDYTEKTYQTNCITLLSNPTGIYPKEPEVFFSLIELMKNAKERVDIHTPYIICNEMMYNSLLDISSMGIDVRLMTNSVANNANPFGAGDYRKNKNRILETGIDIYEYEGGVSYHGKSIAIDDNISIVGSFNMDMRSVYLNTELMLVIDSEELNTQIRRYLESYEADSRLAIDGDNYITPAGLNVQKLSLKKKMQMNLIQFFGSWARFLM